MNKVKPQVVLNKELILHRLIFQDNSKFKIWQKLPNGCYIGTLGYSKENVYILMELLNSFAEQYGEVITYESASEELMLYQNNGKLFIYFDENQRPVSMNGITYNEGNKSVDFKSYDNKNLNSIYFYGLSTLPEYRGRGACTTLIDFAIRYAYYNNFDFVYARTDLTNSNSEWLMQNAGLEICTYEDDIIAEWVDVTDDTGDYRLHMWLPLKSNLYLMPKDEAIMAENNEQRNIKGNKILRKRVEVK